MYKQRLLILVITFTFMLASFVYSYDDCKENGYCQLCKSSKDCTAANNRFPYDIKGTAYECYWDSSSKKCYYKNEVWKNGKFFNSSSLYELHLDNGYSAGWYPLNTRDCYEQYLADKLTDYKFPKNYPCKNGLTNAYFYSKEPLDVSKIKLSINQDCSGASECTNDVKLNYNYSTTGCRDKKGCPVRYGYYCELQCPLNSSIVKYYFCLDNQKVASSKFFVMENKYSIKIDSVDVLVNGNKVQPPLNLSPKDKVSFSVNVTMGNTTIKAPKEAFTCMVLRVRNSSYIWPSFATCNKETTGMASGCYDVVPKSNVNYSYIIGCDGVDKDLKFGCGSRIVSYGWDINSIWDTTYKII